MLRPSKGNMYDFISHTWNPVKGTCSHECRYCYMNKINKRFGITQKPTYLDEKELQTNLGSGNFIFVGSSCDMFSADVEFGNVVKIMDYCRQFNNKYLFQTKDPCSFPYLISREIIPLIFFVCVTLETNRLYSSISRAPTAQHRTEWMSKICDDSRKMITIEPILDFDISEFLRMIRLIAPAQVNIGADTGRNNLPEPPKEKVLELISELQKFTKVVEKKNLKRIIA
jgi:DNA repair photolyase